MNVIFLRLLVLLFALLGIGATFMPWMHYPKGDGIIYGYSVDGVVTGFLFFLVFIYSLFTLRKKRLRWVPAIIAGILGILLAWLSYASIQSIEAEKITFHTTDPLIASVSAGFYQGIGIYMYGIAGLGVFLSILLSLFLQYRYPPVAAKNSSNPELSRTYAILYSAGVLVVVIVLGWLYIQPVNPLVKTDTEQWEPRFEEDIQQMGQALAKGDYEAFMAFNHPMLIQNYGGEEEFRYILENALMEFLQTGYRINGTKFLDVRDIESSGNQLQAVITQELSMQQNGVDTVILQSMLAVSENRGESWYYMDINGKTKDEIQRFFPSLLEDINF